ncbi:MAG: hypothetical protein WCY25_10260 [Moheibacter sp.]
MAKQKGILKLRGTIGDMTFYKSRDGYMVREKGGIEPERIANDPAFQRTRENGEEFGRGGKAGKLFRHAFQGLLIRCFDRRLVSRLHRLMVKIIKTDTVNIRGQRTVTEGNSNMLVGFDFNERSKFDSRFYAPYTSAIDRANGELSVSIPALVPVNLVAAPRGTTHFRIFSGGGEIDFDGEQFSVALSESELLPWDNTPTEALIHTHSVPEASTHPLFLALGIEFFQETNGEFYPLKNGAFNSLTVVAADKV